MIKHYDRIKIYIKTKSLIRCKVPVKWKNFLCEYIESLDDEKLDIYLKILEELYNKHTLNNNCGTISLNAIKLCSKLYRYGFFVFPYIQKIATKGWETSDGTYSFSMPLLNDLEHEICSYNSPAELVKNNVVLDIGYNKNAWCLEVDIA